jgi:hypothetical protein
MKVVHVNVNFVREINLLSLLLEACAPSKIIRSRSSISRFSSFFDFDQKNQFCVDYLRIHLSFCFCLRQSSYAHCIWHSAVHFEVGIKQRLSLSLFSTLRPYLSSPKWVYRDKKDILKNVCAQQLPPYKVKYYYLDGRALAIYQGRYRTWPIWQRSFKTDCNMVLPSHISNWAQKLLLLFVQPSIHLFHT